MSHCGLQQENSRSDNLNLSLKRRLFLYPGKQKASLNQRLNIAQFPVLQGPRKPLFKQKKEKTHPGSNDTYTCKNVAHSIADKRHVGLYKVQQARLFVLLKSNSSSVV
jgi:hypothetical protein